MATWEREWGMGGESTWEREWHWEREWGMATWEREWGMGGESTWEREWGINLGAGMGAVLARTGSRRQGWRVGAGRRYADGERVDLP